MTSPDSGYLANIRNGISVIVQNIKIIHAWVKEHNANVGWEERRAYVVLAALSVGLSAAAVLICFAKIDSTNHQFCQVLATAVPIPKPANPAANPSRERAYESYIKVKALNDALGCPRLP